jgi:PKD repeat protein
MRRSPLAAIMLLSALAAPTTGLTKAWASSPPVITAPATSSFLVGVSGTITGSATDPDAGESVTLSQTNNTPFFPNSSSNGPVLNPSLTLTAVPSPGQAGNYTINWSAADTGVPAGTSTATTALHVGPDPSPPVITAPATAAGTENSAVTITATASDFDANLVTLSQTNNAAFLPSGTSVGPVLNPSLPVTGTPNFSQSGSYTINWVAIDNGSPSLSSSAITALTIANLNRNPVITAPATITGPTNSPVTITGTATDPDGQLVTLSQTNNAAFLSGPSSAGPVLNPSITLTGTPSFTQRGSYTINWSAVDANSPAGSSTATTAVTIGTPGRPPVITAPATFTINRALTFTITGSASDPDVQNVTLSQTNNVPFFPASSSSGPSLNPTIALTGGPSPFIGSFTIQWSAVDVDGGTAAATTALLIYDGNHPPLITAPATVSGNENSAVTITASAVDAEANLVTLSQTNNAAFLTGAGSAGPSLNPSITLTGTPNFTQSGSYTINWLAVDDGTPSLSATATTALTIGGPHRNPVIFLAASMTGTEGQPVSITASASSPDGVNVTLCVSNLPPFLVGGPCAGPSLNPALTIAGTPNNTQAGTYTIQWIATDTTVGTGAATTVLMIADSNGTLALTQPADMAVNEGATATQQLTAFNPGNVSLVFSKVGTTPFFMSVSPSGLVTLAPGFADAGSYTATVRVSDGTTSDQKSFAITVVNVNRCPTANAGGPYSGVLFAAVSFDGTGSSDPDGDVLTYAWDFGDGVTGAGATTSHTYATRGTYSITLTVNDGICSTSATTAATITEVFTATAFTAGGNKATSLNSGKPFTCVEVEPVAGSFDIANVDLGSVKMISMGTGSVSEIAAAAGKTDIAGDKNGNGVSEIQACFAKEDMRLLFSHLPAGRNDVDVMITGSLVTGGSFSASLTLEVKATGGALAASVSPNPLNPSATLSYSTTKPGAVKIALYDLNGRLVRTYLDESQAAGTHDVTIEGKSASGSPLASSVYFLKIETESDGAETKSLTILK